MELIKSTFALKKNVESEQKEDKQAEYEKKAIESIGGSMVFVERKKIYWDGKP